MSSDLQQKIAPSLPNYRHLLKKRYVKLVSKYIPKTDKNLIFSQKRKNNI